MNNTDPAIEAAEEYVAGGYGCDGDTSKDSFLKGVQWCRENEMPKNYDAIVAKLNAARSWRLRNCRG